MALEGSTLTEEVACALEESSGGEEVGAFGNGTVDGTLAEDWCLGEEVECSFDNGNGGPLTNKGVSSCCNLNLSG